MRLLLGIVMVLLLRPSAAFYISTFAGGGSSLVDGVAATTASFSLPLQMWIDTAETFMYIADYYNCRVRQVSLVTATNSITTFAGTGTCAASAGDGVGCHRRNAQQS